MTPTPTSTSTNTPTPTNTCTQTPTPSNTPTPPATPTQTPTPSETPPPTELYIYAQYVNNQPSAGDELEYRINSGTWLSFGGPISSNSCSFFTVINSGLAVGDLVEFKTTFDTSLSGNLSTCPGSAQTPTPSITASQTQTNTNKLNQTKTQTNEIQPEHVRQRQRCSQ